ncbi:PRD domain-containing protein [Bacillus canaveralius]|uniref:PRD domain-containing protein n=1 Tax=Bacillus canaveralius TaxID=1403243 RepID=A0A2N5GSC5_9BACI|nr:PRD domain-containing protein [Bacillus canaveralius]PLR86551.1 PRD domain-containing protein [Bacillus canaveralius]PLS00322.1 PRD domain-containing protein [Bacillus canaveralius]
MDKAELNERLELLLTGGVITAEAAAITEKAFENLGSMMNKTAILQSEMLFTHLASALTRLARGEMIEGPPEALLNEVSRTGFNEKIEKEIEFIETQFGNALPVEEKNYLHLHYASVFQQNLLENQV